MRGASCILLSMLLLSCCCWGRSLQPKGEEAFVGWTGESYKPPERSGVQGQANDGSNKWIETVSWKPRAFIYHNFLSDEEAEHIKKLAAPMMKRSTVVGPHGENVLDDYRTSYGTFIKRKADPIIEVIEERVSKWAMIPTINSEDMQVLRYGLGQQYKPHMDSLSDDQAGPRVCTVLLYLNDVPEGGETAFPDSNYWVDKSLPDRLGPFSECAKGRVAFRPKKGDAFMFWSVHPDGVKQDSYSMHTGCPVLHGVKWTATKWLHGRPFRSETFGDKTPFERIDPGMCENYHEQCENWAKSGECEKNPGYMVGDVAGPGKCPKACDTCTVCAKGDQKCYNENRKKAGFLVYDENELDSDDHTAQP